MFPPPDSGIDTEWITSFDAKRIFSTLNILAKAYFPIPRFIFRFWNTNILSMLPESHIIQFLLSILLLLFGVFLFLRKPAALFVYAVGTIGLLTFFYMKHFGYMRHYGFLFLTFVCAIWISKYCYEREKIFSPLKKLGLFLEKRINVVLVIILCTHFIAGIYASSMDLKLAFSQGKAMADFIKEKDMDKLPLVGDFDNVVSTVSAYLGRNIYYPRSDRLGSFIIWNMRRMRYISNEYIVKKAQAISHREGKTCLIIMTRTLSSDLIAKYSLKLIWKSGDAIVPYEKYFLYIYSMERNRSG
jgi:hypothetical protein